MEIDIEEDQEIAEAAGIMGTPCVQFFKNKEMLRSDQTVETRATFLCSLFISKHLFHLCYMHEKYFPNALSFLELFIRVSEAPHHPQSLYFVNLVYFLRKKKETESRNWLGGYSSTDMRHTRLF